MDNNYQVFNYIKPSENTKISNFHGYDLKDLFDKINGYYLEYRNKLNVSNKGSIGCEIEFENKKKNLLTPQEEIDYEIQPGWILREDGSLKHGGEIISPIFYNNVSSWENFKKIFDLFDEKHCIRSTCSSHVHIGVPLLGSKPNSWNNFLRLWSVYENIIYRFCYGEYINPRSSIGKYAFPIAGKIDNCLDNIQKEYSDYYDPTKIMPLKEYEFKSKLLKSRYSAVNFLNVSNLTRFGEYNTLEFRVANGCLNPIVWQNFINLYLSMLEYSKSNLFDMDTVMKRREKIDNFGKFECYNKLYYDQLVEFCDLIFKRNIDKVYFIRQYLKDYSVSDSENLIRAKKFTI